MPNSNDKFNSAIEVLNNFRNKYYSDTSGTEKYVVANAINEILPTFCKLTQDDFSSNYEEVDREDLQRLMTKYGAVIRAIPETSTSILEVYHKGENSTAIKEEIKYSKRFQRNMLYVTQKNRLGGKLLLTFTPGQSSLVQFHNKYEYTFDSLEEIYNYLLQREEGENRNKKEMSLSNNPMTNEIVFAIKKACQTINACCTRRPPFLTQNASFYKLNISLLESLVDILNRQGFNTEVVTRRVTPYTDVFIIKSVKINMGSYEKVLEFDIPTD